MTKPKLTSPILQGLDKPSKTIDTRHLVTKLVALLALLTCITLPSMSAADETLGPDERESFRLVVRLSGNKFSELDDETLSRLAMLNGGTEINRGLVAFLQSQISEENMLAQINQLHSWRVLVADGRQEDVFRSLFRVAGMSRVETHFDRLRAEGWSISLTNDPIFVRGQRVTGVMRPNAKEIEVAIGLSDEVTPLVLAEEILHAVDWGILQRSREAIESHLRMTLAENTTPGIDTMSQAERYHFSFIASLDRMAKEVVSKTEVDKLLQFALEQSAYLTKLKVYLQMRADKPELQNKIWETIVGSDDPAETVNLVLTELRFSELEPGLASRLGPVSLIELAGLGDENFTSDLALALQSVTQDRPSLEGIPWSTAEEFFDDLPEFLNGWDGFEFRFIFDQDQLETMGRLISIPEFTHAPYRLGLAVRRQFSLGYGDAEIYNLFNSIVQTLVSNDSKNNTRLTEKYVFPMLARLEADEATEDHRSLFFYASRIFNDGFGDPQLASNFLKVLVNSRSAASFLHDPNRRFGDILKLVAQGFGSGAKLDITLDEIDAIILESYNHFVGEAARNVTGSSYLDFRSAQIVIQEGLEFFSHVGNNKFVDLYLARLHLITERLEKNIAQSRRASLERATTPESFDESQIGTNAALMIVSLQKSIDDVAAGRTSSFQSTSLRLGNAIRWCSRLLIKRRSRNKD